MILKISFFRIFLTFFKKMINRFMIKCRKKSEKTLGSKIKKKGYFKGFLIKKQKKNI
jgi:hypothetical protein